MKSQNFGQQKVQYMENLVKINLREHHLGERAAQIFHNQTLSKALSEIESILISIRLCQCHVYGYVYLCKKQWSLTFFPSRACQRCKCNDTFLLHYEAD